MSPTEIQRSQPVPTSHTWECPITTPPHIQAETDKDAGVHCSPHTPPSANSTSTTPITPISSAAQQNRKTHTPDPHSHPQGPFLQATPRDLGSHAVRPTDPHTTLGLTPREGVELVTHTQLTTPPRGHPPSPSGSPAPNPLTTHALTRGETDAQRPWVKLHKTQSIHTRTSCTQSLGALTYAHAGPRCYTQSSTLKTPAPRLPAAPRARLPAAHTPCSCP